MPYYRSVGQVPRKRHTQFRRPDGGLYAEELMGVEGFSSDSALLYHRHLPTAIVDAVPHEPVAWSRRRRAHLFAEDLRALGAEPDTGARPELPAVEDTDQALGRLYVLEGSTLGGTFIARHLATLPTLGPDVRLGAFSPYGAETGAMWHAYRRVTRERVAAGGDAGRVVAAARATFTALAAWCTPVGAPA